MLRLNCEKMIGEVEETMTAKFIKDEIPAEFQDIYKKVK